jgi:hypothetical protein
MTCRTREVRGAQLCAVERVVQPAHADTQASRQGTGSSLHSLATKAANDLWSAVPARHDMLAHVALQRRRWGICANVILVVF